MALCLSLRVIFLVTFCHIATGQGKDNRPKNIKMLFVPSEVMKSLRKNLTVKDLPAGLPGQGTQRWSPVHLPGDKTHSFEIRINPRAAHKLNMNFQHIKIGRGEGLLLELRNVSLSRKGKTMLDRLIEFYKNCGSKKPQRLRRPRPSLKHSLLLPGDIPLLKRIQSALERFFPKRHDGSVDVYQHKDSNGAVHFLPFEEVRKQVNSLIRRTLVRRDCVKISSHALTQALEAFRRQAKQQTTPTEATVGENEEGSINNSDEAEINDESNESNEDNSDNDTNNSDDHKNSNTKNNDESLTNNENTENSDSINISEDSNSNKDEGNFNGDYSNSYESNNNYETSFSRNLGIMNTRAGSRANLTSSSATLNVPSDTTATKIVSALADLRKEIKVLTSNFRQNQHIPNDTKNVGPAIFNNNKNIKNISSSDKESNDEGKDDKLDLNKVIDNGEGKNRPKKMSSDDADDKNSNKVVGNKDISLKRPSNTSMVTNTSKMMKADSGITAVKSAKNVTKTFEQSVSEKTFEKQKDFPEVNHVNQTVNQTLPKPFGSAINQAVIKQSGNQNVNQPTTQAINRPSIEAVIHQLVNQAVSHQQAISHQASNQAVARLVDQIVSHRLFKQSGERQPNKEAVNHPSANQVTDFQRANQGLDHQPVNQGLDHQSLDHHEVYQEADHQPVDQAVGQTHVNQGDSYTQRMAGSKEESGAIVYKNVSTQPVVHIEKKKDADEGKRKESKTGADRVEQAVHIKDIEDRERPSLVFHYRPKKVRDESSGGTENDIKATSEDKDEGYEDSVKERFRKIRRLRRPRVKELMLQDDDDEDNENEISNHEKVYDVPEEVNDDDDNLKARLLRKLRRLRIRHRFNHGHKSPKLRVVVYDDDLDDKIPHEKNWRNSETEEFSQKIHEEDSDTEPEPSLHRSDSVLMDDDNTQENTQQYEQQESRNSADSDNDIQELSDSIGDDSHLNIKGGRGGENVPDLEPYLKKHYEDEEDEENEEIKMYNDQDGIDARKLTKIGDTEASTVTKPLKDEDTVVTEKTQGVESDEDDDETSKIRIHKLPFKIQEDSDGVDTTLLKDSPHDALGMQQVLSAPSYPSVASAPISMPANPPAATNQNGLDLSPNVVMPPEQTTIMTGDGNQLPQMPNAFQMPRPNVPATFTGLVNYEPSVTTQMNNLMPQTPFPQVGSVMPAIPPRSPEIATPMTPVMQPGQMRATISRGVKPATKRTENGVRKALTPPSPKSKKQSGLSRVLPVTKQRSKFHKEEGNKLAIGSQHKKTAKMAT